MRIIFMGTPEFAVPTLKKLYQSKHEIVAVVTKPDQKRGRGQKVSFSPVKELAISHGTLVLQPEKIKGNNDFIDTLIKLNADVFVVVAYGKILPKKVLDIPKKGCINVHGSLLPKYRGAAPIHWALLNGEKTTGVTTMLMDEGMDTGDMLLKAEIPIEEGDNVETLHEKLAEIGADLLIKTLEQLEEGTLKPEKQQEALASYAPMVTKEMGLIDWSLPAKNIYNKLRGLNPWPGTFTYIRGDRLKIISGEIYQGFLQSQEPGTIVEIIKKGIIVATGEGSILIKEVQPANKEKMDSYSYVNGYKIKRGEKFE
ncbi:methionyl-tRNA formyltransferase [Anaerobranca californiensis DSM 14826]|jgi:methionyl-tRNA formyltransferase|uniref:Methionyl-tRNA formyltransferase n=1 Tax=Anaerobranca californiensis DSM 14826 TaxID=1120989 RepID=A0A1M6KQR8_9FIRM|nr:methionyl-tRNA formyltransferase [Anaerobranca californiensis]SHJ61289.1 methionyl-tRNA formyltransferase [Anaerobranca californiensis DSM 14826]